MLIDFFIVNLPFGLNIDHIVTASKFLPIKVIILILNAKNMRI